MCDIVDLSIVAGILSQSLISIQLGSRNGNPVIPLPACFCFCFCSFLCLDHKCRPRCCQSRVDSGPAYCSPPRSRRRHRRRTQTRADPQRSHSGTSAATQTDADAAAMRSRARAWLPLPLPLALALALLALCAHMTGSYAQVSVWPACPLALPLSGRCPAGHFNPVASGSGSGGSGGGESQLQLPPCCYPCTAGTFSALEGLNGTSGCLPCAAGSFAPVAAASSCTLCPPGTSSGQPGASSCTPCGAGRFAPSTGASTCTSCGVNFFSPVVAGTSCLPCDPPLLQRTPDGISCLLAHPDPAPTPAPVCADGHFLSANRSACEPCAAGSWAVGPAAASCTLCPPGQRTQHPGEGNSACVDCAAGFFAAQAGAESCAPCPLGSFSAAGALACTACPPNTFAPAPAAETCQPCEGEVVVPTPDAGAGGWGCAVCEAGSFLERSGVTLRCMLCPPGQYGTTSNAARCSFCPVGTAQPSRGATECAACIPGSVAVRGSALCIPCAAGWFAPSSTVAAANATANGGNVTSTCEQCPPGRYASIPGSLSCTLCPPGYFQPLPGQLLCTLCAPGFLVGSNGTTCSAPAAPPPAAECNFGQERLVDDSVAGGFRCVNCSAGRFSNDRNPATCTLCSPGSFSPGTGAVQCVLCPPGTASGAPGAVQCEPCLSGFVAALPGATRCDPCGPGFFFSNSSSSGGDGSSSTLPSLAVSLAVAVACAPCASGTFSAGTGSSQCQPCAPGTFQSLAGSSSCGTCPPGMVQPLPGQSRCIPCRFGYSSGSSGGVECAPCGPGRFAAQNGTATCEPCTPGSFSASPGATGCDACAVGTASAAWGLATPCPACDDPAVDDADDADAAAGESTSARDSPYAPRTGMSSCLLCPPGLLRQVRTREANPVPLCLPRGTAEGSVALQLEYEPLAGSSVSATVARANFSAAFVADLVRAENCSAVRVHVLALERGSVVVRFGITPPLPPNSTASVSSSNSNSSSSASGSTSGGGLPFVPPEWEMDAVALMRRLQAQLSLPLSARNGSTLFSGGSLFAHAAAPTSTNGSSSSSPLEFVSLCLNHTDGTFLPVSNAPCPVAPLAPTSETPPPAAGASHDQTARLGLIWGAAIGSGIAAALLLFAWCYRYRRNKRLVAVKSTPTTGTGTGMGVHDDDGEGEGPRWGVADAPDDLAVPQQPSRADYVDGVRPHAIGWGF